MKKIEIGEIFFAKFSCFYDFCIDDYRDTANEDPQYKYPLLWQGCLENVITGGYKFVPSDTIFAFKYIEKGKVIELSTGKEFLFESNMVEEEFFLPYYGCENHAYNGKYYDRYNEEIEDLVLLTIDEYNNIYSEYVETAITNPIVIKLDERDFLEVNAENKKKYLENSDEERIALINYCIAVSNNSFKKDINKINHNENNIEQEAYLDNMLYDFKQVNSNRKK